MEVLFMYEIRPETIKTFITDRNVKLPRFQRKQTWDDKKNFKLCISLFKQYPIGVCILSVDERKGKIVRWLLDGRQRRNALQLMYEDPENIYKWGKKFIGFKNSDQINEVEDKYRIKIDEYIEEETTEESSDDNITEALNDGDEDTTATTETENVESVNEGTFGLELLLEIIKIIHNQNKKWTGFTRPFDFSKYIKKLPYLENVNGTEKLSSKKVKAFIDEFQQYCYQEGRDETNKEVFYEFIKNKYDITDQNSLKKAISNNWKAIQERMLIIDKIDDLLSSCKIGMIEVKNLTPADSQKIFEIINSSGEKLTAVEILSAKPLWNVPIERPSDDTVRAVKDMYARINIQQDTVVKWDMAATFVRRLGDNFIIRKFNDSNSKDIGKELTIGFKVLAGIYKEGVKKESIEELGKAAINWNSGIDELVSDLRNMLKLICGFSYFKYFSSWQISIMELTSEAIAINYLILCYKDWERKGKPIGDNVAKRFQKNAFILWDKLIYEYINRLWRGAADQRTANNIALLKNEPDMFVPIDAAEWKSLLQDQIFKSSTAAGENVSVALMRPLLYHFYCLKKIARPDTNYSIEVDHIIPQDLFKQSTIERKEVIQDNLLNLGLLPKSENAAKSNKRLSIIDDDWLKDQIVKYEFIDKGDFNEFSNVNNYIKMFEKRAPIILDAYEQCRNNMLNN